MDCIYTHTDLEGLGHVQVATLDVLRLAVGLWVLFLIHLHLWFPFGFAGRALPYGELVGVGWEVHTIANPVGLVVVEGAAVEGGPGMASKELA